MSHKQVLINFVQHDLEPLHRAWRRYKNLFMRFPYHSLSRECLLEVFLNGLHATTREWVERGDGTTNFYQLSIDEAYWMLEDMVEYDEWYCLLSPITNQVLENNFSHMEPTFEDCTQEPWEETLEDFQDFIIEEEPHQVDQSSSFEALMREFMAKNDALIQS